MCPEAQNICIKILIAAVSPVGFWGDWLTVWHTVGTGVRVGPRGGLCAGTSSTAPSSGVPTSSKPGPVSQAQTLTLSPAAL